MTILEPRLGLGDDASLGAFANQLAERKTIDACRVGDHLLEVAFEHLPGELVGVLEALNHRVAKLFIGRSAFGPHCGAIEARECSVEGRQVEQHTPERA